MKPSLLRNPGFLKNPGLSFWLSIKTFREKKDLKNCLLVVYITGHMDAYTPIQFRYDFEDTDSVQQPLQVISTFLQEYHPGVLGVENHNKYGEVIKTHLHYNFLYPGNEVDARKFCEKVRRRILRYYADRDVVRNRGFYSIVAKTDIDDLHRWLRYPLKQVASASDIITNIRIKVPDGFDLLVEWQCASEEYARDKEFLSRRREKKDRGQTTFQKILELIQEESKVFVNVRCIFNFVVNYYIDNEIPLERHKIRSIVDSISVMQRLLSYDDYYSQVMA